MLYTFSTIVIANCLFIFYFVYANKMQTVERTLIKAQQNLVSRHSDIEKVVRILFIEIGAKTRSILQNNAQ